MDWCPGWTLSPQSALMLWLTLAAIVSPALCPAHSCALGCQLGGPCPTCLVATHLLVLHPSGIPWPHCSLTGVLWASVEEGELGYLSVFLLKGRFMTIILWALGLTTVTWGEISQPQCERKCAVHMDTGYKHSYLRPHPYPPGWVLSEWEGTDSILTTAATYCTGIWKNSRWQRGPEEWQENTVGGHQRHYWPSHWNEMSQNNYD